MELHGVIVGKSDSAPLDRDRWIALCESDPRLVRGSPVTRPNPFKPGEMIVIQPRRDAASVVVSSRKLGLREWAADESPLLNVWGSDLAIALIAREIAFLLDAIYSAEVERPIAIVASY
ncbi:MAG: hypothetical protein JWP89_2255 [Schlesneria sp.]|nr:hypothetical protein [Schlesneria sp.]